MQSQEHRPRRIPEFACRTVFVLVELLMLETGDERVLKLESALEVKTNRDHLETVI
jgi:hypothetical protein